MEDLVGYVREFNKSHQSKLHIWSRTRPPGLNALPIMVRFSVPDVLVAFIALGLNTTSVLVVETVTAFGPRETVK